MGGKVTVLVPLLVNTPVVTRMGLDATRLPVEAISAEETVNQAFTALVEDKPATMPRTDLATRYERLRTAAGEAIKVRLAASQPAH